MTPNPIVEFADVQAPSQIQTGIKLAKELQWERVIFKTDNTRVAEILWFGLSPQQENQSLWIQFCVKELSGHMD